MADDEVVERDDIDESEQDDETEEQARQSGWVDRDEWKGDPERWRPAKEFLEVAETDTNIAGNEVRKLRGQMKAIQSQLSKATAGMLAAERRGYERAMKGLQERELKAVEDGDTEEFAQIRREASELQQEMAGQTQPADTGVGEFYRQYPWAKRPEFNGEMQQAYAAEMVAAGGDPSDFDADVAVRAAEAVIENNPNLARFRKAKPEAKTAPRKARDTTESGARSAAPGGVWSGVDSAAKGFFEEQFEEGCWGNMSKADAAKKYVADLKAISR